MDFSRRRAATHAFEVKTISHFLFRRLNAPFPSLSLLIHVITFFILRYIALGYSPFENRYILSSKIKNKMYRRGCSLNWSAIFHLTRGFDLFHIFVLRFAKKRISYSIVDPLCLILRWSTRSRTSRTSIFPPNFRNLSAEFQYFPPFFGVCIITPNRSASRTLPLTPSPPPDILPLMREK